MRGKFAFLYLVVAAVTISVANAGCTRTRVEVSTRDSIATAMKNARPGDDIVVAPGTYAMGSFSFGGKGVNDCPIAFFCNVSGAAHFIGTLVLDGMSFVNVSNITIESDGDHAVSAVNAESLSFESVHVFNSKSETMRFDSCSDVTIHNCTFDHTDYLSFYVLRSNNFLVEECLFGDAITNSAVEIDIQCYNIVIRSNSFVGSGYLSDYPSWIYIRSGRNEISRNHFYNTDNHEMYTGIWVIEKVSGIVFKENFMVMYGQKDSCVGIEVYDCAESQLVCASNKVFGVSMTDGKIDPSC